MFCWLVLVSMLIDDVVVLVCEVVMELCSDLVVYCNLWLLMEL